MSSVKIVLVLMSILYLTYVGFTVKSRLAYVVEGEVEKIMDKSEEVQ